MEIRGEPYAFRYRRRGIWTAPTSKTPSSPNRMELSRIVKPRQQFSSCCGHEPLRSLQLLPGFRTADPLAEIRSRFGRRRETASGGVRLSFADGIVERRGARQQVGRPRLGDGAYAGFLSNPRQLDSSRFARNENGGGANQQAHSDIGGYRNGAAELLVLYQSSFIIR